MNLLCRFVVVLILSGVVLGQIPSTLQKSLFYQDTTATFRGFNQPVIDSKGNLIVVGTQFGFSCGFNVCGVLVYSIASTGKPNWIKPDTGFAAPAVNQIAVGLDDTFYFQGYWALDQIYAFSPDGSTAPGWPVNIGFPLDTMARTLLIDPLDGTLLTKGGTDFSFGAFPGRVAAYHQDSSVKWESDFANAANNTPGMVIGPNGNIYTTADQGVLLDRNTGQQLCGFGPFAPLVGGSSGVFTHSGGQIIRLNADCTTTPIFTTPQGAIEVQDYDNAIVFATDHAPFDGTQTRLIGVQSDGTFLWRNNAFLPSGGVSTISVIRNGRLYVLGIDIADQKQKLFVLNENTGAILDVFDTTGTCDSCGVAVAPDGTIYLNALGSLTIYRLSPISTGTLTVTTNLGTATFDVMGPINLSGTGSLTQTVPVGSYTVKFNDVPGFITPPPQKVSVTNAQPANVSGMYQVALGTVNVVSTPVGAGFSLSGPGLIFYQGFGGSPTNPFTTQTPPGDYTITWGILLDGYITPVTQTQHLDAGRSITFTGIYGRVPLALVVPGLGASTLTDSSGNNQWFSCSSIINLSNNAITGRFASLQFDDNGNPLPGFSLTPTEVLAQSDSISDDLKLSNQSLVQCADDDLINEAAAANWKGALLPAICGSPLAIGYRGCLQAEIVGASDGVLLQFNDLLARLSKEGYDPQGWPYDFRRGVPALADDLFAAIQHISSDHSGRPVVIVAHSMGSIVTAAMIQRHPEIYNSGTVASIITLGAPFGGGLKSYLASQGWEDFVPFISATDTKDLGGKWTSVYDLLPQWEFVKSANPPVFTTYLPNTEVFDGTGSPSEFPPMPRVNALPGAYELWNSLANFGASVGPLSRWHAFIGYGQKTEFQLTRATGLPEGTCVNSGINCGITHTCWFKDYADGDGTVPRLQSAEAGSLVDPANRIYVKNIHSALPGDSAVIDGIVNILQGKSPFAVAGLTPQPDQFNTPPHTQFNSCSPVDLVATSSSGQSVGDSGIQIPDADYSKIAGSTQILVPSNDNYVLQAKGIALGTFEVVISQLDNLQQPTTVGVLSGIAAPGLVSTYQVSTTSGGVPNVLLVATFQSTLDDIKNSLKLGLIDNAGLANSLAAKLQAAQTGSMSSRLNVLNAFTNEVNAQAGKHIKGSVIEVLTADVKSLVQQLR